MTKMMDGASRLRCKFMLHFFNLRLKKLYIEYFELLIMLIYNIINFILKKLIFLIKFKLFNFLKIKNII